MSHVGVTPVDRNTDPASAERYVTPSRSKVCRSVATLSASISTRNPPTGAVPGISVHCAAASPAARVRPAKRVAMTERMGKTNQANSRHTVATRKVTPKPSASGIKVETAVHFTLPVSL